MEFGPESIDIQGKVIVQKRLNLIGELHEQGDIKGGFGLTREHDTLDRREKRRGRG